MTHSASAADACTQVSSHGYNDKVPVASGRFPGNLFINVAVMCLVNEERAKKHLPPVADNPALIGAAGKHAKNAVRLKWWGHGANSHVNPETNSTVGRRLAEENYCPSPRQFYKYSEVTYTGWDGKGTPREAVNWWVNISTAGHREIILDPQLEQLGVGTWGGAADTDGAGHAGAGTYVIDFGTCHR
ncbi:MULTISPECIES: CAP domain-containing protein [Streptomyces]|uniref:CAP domain-containing protein n=1 Tax=Streptomyces TaxID=1883 RepID=UPI00331DD287